MSVIDELDFFDFENEDVLDGITYARTKPEPKQEDVSFDDYEPRFPKARTDLKCGDCGAPMEVRPSKYGCFYGCTRWPDCTGTHGAHADGAPKGTPANKATREARIRAHRVFDQLWKGGPLSRRDAYEWMRITLGLSRSEAHIGRFDLQQCEQLIALVYHDYPTLHTRYSRLAWEEDHDT